MILEISFVFISLLFVTSCYVIWNLNTKQEMLEDWISDFIKSIEKINFDLKQIDYRGAFASDDETGAIFNEIKNTIKQLDKFKGEQQ